MQKAKEYKILPQIEEDNFYIHDRRKQGWLYCFVGLLVVLLLLGIGATVVVLCGWTDDLYKVLRQSLQGAENITGSLGGHFERMNHGSGVTLGPTNNSSSSEEYYYTSSGEMINSTWATTSAETDTNGTVTQAPPNGIDEYNAGVKFAEMMRRFEKILEKFSGIHQAELVIPLFMLMLLMGTLAIISLCCCMMSKQREKKQRKLLGKIITDLHTGDSKTVLLGRDDDI